METGVCSEKACAENRGGLEAQFGICSFIIYGRGGRLRAFSIGFTWNGREWVKRPDFKYEIGWCGQNASLALSLLYDYQMNGREESLRYGTAVLDSWVEKARSKEGLLLTRYDPEDSLIDACNLGTAGQQFFEAYDQAKRMGLDKKNWLDAAFEICVLPCPDSVWTAVSA